MFDCNNEELANIIWGEAGESDDHIVPYPKGIEERTPGLCGDHIIKGWNGEPKSIKPAEQNKSEAKKDYPGGKEENGSQYDPTGGISAGEIRVDPWPDLPLSHAAKTDQHCMGIEVSKNSTEVTKFDASRGDETSQLDDGSEIFQNQHEDGEQSDFVDYGWANIGSFDDLDRIFRFTQIPDAEAETNHIDRTVAHLLFHRPLETSAKQPKTPELPGSTILLYKRTTR